MIASMSIGLLGWVLALLPHGLEKFCCIRPADLDAFVAVLGNGDGCVASSGVSKLAALLDDESELLRLVVVGGLSPPCMYLIHCIVLSVKGFVHALDVCSNLRGFLLLVFFALFPFA